MEKPLNLKTRREFLRTTLLGGALTWTVPSFLSQTFTALESQAADSATQIVTGKDGTILVVLQMAGGNDGLNTVVPFMDDEYRKARPTLAHAKGKVYKLTDNIALHPAMTGFKSLYDAGELSVIQGVGYPNPNRSHFRSTEIWQTASDANKFEKYGWIGRYFDNACPGADPTVGVNVGRQMPQAFASSRPLGISLENPEKYRYVDTDLPKMDETSGAEPFYRQLNQLEDQPMMTEDMDTNSGDSIGAVAGKVPAGISPLDYLERTALDAQVSSDQIRAVSQKVKNQATYPATPLGESLKLVARLIGGGLPSRIFYVSQGGYDTHTNQLPAQERLLKDLAESVKAFTADMKAQGNFPRVTLMTFSEFGRRVRENASGGTDHGAAGPMFVIGPKVRAGLQGEYPSLAKEDLFNGDLKYKVDFRSVYAGLLESWLKTPSAPVLGKKFDPLTVV